jgi:hypothetical protein
MVMRAYVEVTQKSALTVYRADSGYYRILIGNQVHPGLVGMTKDDAEDMVSDFQKLKLWVESHPSD